VDEEPEFYFPTLWHKAPENAKQGASAETVVLPWDIPQLTTEVALRAYNDLLTAGVAPEEARMILPLNTMSEWIWTGSLAFFARVFQQRSDAHAQLLAQEFAKQVAANIPEEFQHSWKALTSV
jgi:thymidylate synthase (FAD)